MTNLKAIGCAALCLLLAPWAALAGTATLTWTANTEADLAGYKIYQGTAPGVYGIPVVLGKVATYTVTLPDKFTEQRYYFALTAFDTTGNESVKSLEVSKLIPAMVYFKTVTDAAAVKWGLVAVGAAYRIYRNDVLVSGLAKELRLRNGLAEVLSTEAIPAWYTWDGTKWIVSDTTPPTVPGGLVVASLSPDEVVILASVLDCPRVLTSTKGSTAVQAKRTVSCVRG